MKKADLRADIFEECLRRTQQGEPLESVLADYAGMADELRPLVETAQLLGRPVHVSQVARARSQARFLAAARQARRTEVEQARARLAFDLRKPVLLYRWLPARIIAAVVLVLVLLSSSVYGVNQVAAQSIPGDRLYSVKLAVEHVQLQLAPNVVTRLKLESEFTERRKVEVEHLIQDDRVEPVVFSGFAIQQDTGKWHISGIPVDLTPEQEKQLATSQRLLMQVQGLVQKDGSVLVQKAGPRPFNFNGKVEEVDSQGWMVDGVKFAVSKNTQISGNPQVGSNVAVSVVEDDDDEYTALFVNDQDHTGNSSDVTPKLPNNDSQEQHGSEEDGD